MDGIRTWITKDQSRAGPDPQPANPLIAAYARFDHGRHGHHERRQGP
ncbi:hypothetical protein ACOT81_25060 [Streptomyces sp. WI04-05B]|nr:hypothetical protein [Streptomyces sp. AK08-02]